VWYLVLTFPPRILFFATVIAATALLISRNESHLKPLRIVIFSSLIIHFIWAILSAFHPPFEALAISNFSGAFGALIWTLYFNDSVRVSRVFIKHNWGDQAVSSL
jgi:hypothetical protein